MVVSQGVSGLKNIGPFQSAKRKHKPTSNTKNMEKTPSNKMGWKMIRI